MAALVHLVVFLLALLPSFHSPTVADACGRGPRGRRCLVRRVRNLNLRTAALSESVAAWEHKLSRMREALELALLQNGQLEVRVESLERAVESLLKCRPPCRGPKNPCDSSPCLNGGTCSDAGEEQFECRCPPGFAGDRCQKPTASNCASNPCLNGAVCREDSCGLRCLCRAGYSGPHCETAGTNQPSCSAKTCLHGSCVGGHCRCLDGWAGLLCERFSPQEGLNASSGCDSPRYRTGNGTVMSHDGYNGVNNFYPTSRNCSWTFTSELGGQVCLSFEKVDLRTGTDWPSHDYVAIYTGTGQEPDLVRRYFPWENPGVICSGGDQLTLRFVSRKRDHSGWGSGFNLVYSSHCPPM